jgi:hypothetical protein
MQDHWTGSQIVTAILGVLGFVLSCYNFLIVQRRKDQDDRQRRFADIRFRFGQQRQLAMELMVSSQLAALRKKQVLTDILYQARQAGRQNSVAQLQPLVTQAEAELTEAELQVKELSSLTLPQNASAGEIQALEESYGKVIIGLKTGVATREAELKQVDRIVEIVKDDIAKHP